jgi:hypothetical protein
MKLPTTYSIRLPAGIRAEVEKLAKREGISVNQFIVLAVAQKISALHAETYLAERRARADIDEFDRIMRRKGSAPPRDDDRLD